MKNKEDTFLMEGDRLILKHFGEYIILFGVFYLFFDLVLLTPKILSLIFPIFISYLIIKFIDKKQSKKRKTKK